MVHAVRLIILLCWIPQAIFTLLTLAYWIQVKEYRLDRIKSFMLTVDGKKKLLLFPYIVKILLVLLSVFLRPLIYLYLLVLIILDLEFVRKVLVKSIKKPVFTVRARRILLPGMLVILAVFSAAATRGEVATILFFGELGLALSLPLGVVLTASLVNRTLTKEVKKAKDKLSKINPKVVAITGSYGKTTTKDFLTEILQRKYITEKTIRNENTDFGIARKIINHFREDTEMFVVEMGAYRKGDIERLCEIVNPRVGVITGIEPQHAELFSGIDAIVKTKFELIEALPGKSLAVFNTSNPLSNKLYEKAKKLPSKLNVQGCYVKKKGTRIDSEWSAEITKVNEEGVWFEVFGEGTHRKLFTPVAGVHFVENLLVSIAVARYFKISWKDIGTAVSQVKVKKGTMSVTNYPYGSVIVNDTYNSTPNGFESAIRYLENFKNKKKLIITSGIIELGSYSKSVHKKIGRLASKTTDELIVTNSQYAGEMSAGLGEGEKVVSFIDDTDKLIEKAEEYIEAGAVILLEGRLPYKFMNFIDNRNSQHK